MTTYIPSGEITQAEALSKVLDAEELSVLVRSRLGISVTEAQEGEHQAVASILHCTCFVPPMCALRLMSLIPIYRLSNKTGQRQQQQGSA